MDWKHCPSEKIAGVQKSKTKDLQLNQIEKHRTVGSQNHRCLLCWSCLRNRINQNWRDQEIKWLKYQVNWVRYHTGRMARGPRRTCKWMSTMNKQDCWVQTRGHMCTTIADPAGESPHLSVTSSKHYSWRNSNKKLEESIALGHPRIPHNKPQPPTTALSLPCIIWTARGAAAPQSFTRDHKIKER